VNGRGLRVAGQVVPGTEWVRRDPRAQWRAGDRGTRPRAGTVDLLVGHWTAGQPRTGEDAGRRVYDAMRSRKKPDGSPLDVGIHFAIGWDGIVHQLADLAIATVHVGSGPVNARSVGVECCWPGTAKQAAALKIAGSTSRVLVGGHRVDVLLPSPELVAGWVRLASLLASLGGLGGISIPRQVPATTARFQPWQQRRWKGAQEHAHVPGSTKVDAAGLLVGALDWLRVAP
jgi:hypothetical protein